MALDHGFRNPERLQPDAIDVESAALNRRIRDLMASAPPMETQRPAAIRAARQRGEGMFGPIERSPRAKSRTIAGVAGAIPLRVFVPDAGAIRGVYLHIHGGGWMLGGADQQDARLLEIADRCSLAIVSVDYRLAPEHPYPAGPDDCEAAARWLAANALREFDTNRLLIGGESAGAHLAAVTMVRLRDRPGQVPFVVANLVFGAFDLHLTPSVRRFGSAPLILSTDSIEWMVDSFVPPGIDRGIADVSPLNADLRGLPSALFTVGTHDPLLDDTLFMYSRWIAAGSPAQLAVYPGGAHGFTGFPTALAREANERIVEFLAR